MSRGENRPFLAWRPTKRTTTTKGLAVVVWGGGIGRN